MDEIFPKGAAWIDGQFVKLSDAKIQVDLVRKRLKDLE